MLSPYKGASTKHSHTSFDIHVTKRSAPTHAATQRRATHTGSSSPQHDGTTRETTDRAEANRCSYRAAHSASAVRNGEVAVLDQVLNHAAVFLGTLERVIFHLPDTLANDATDPKEIKLPTLATLSILRTLPRLEARTR